jgi:hypothetical protein
MGVRAYTLIGVRKRYVNRLVLRLAIHPFHKLPVRFRHRCR